MTKTAKTAQAAAARSPQATALRVFATTALALGALLTVAIASHPAQAAEKHQNQPSISSSAKVPAPQAGNHGASGTYPKGGLSAADARKGFKPSFGAKPYRYFGRHGYGKFGISRFGQSKRRH
ncbi:MAG: hypothetical protein AAF495_07015 [Pseudomonadota bacterium]